MSDAMMPPPARSNSCRIFRIASIVLLCKEPGMLVRQLTDLVARLNKPHAPRKLSKLVPERIHLQRPPHKGTPASWL